MNNVLAMILAGGRGTRLELLSQRRPKPVMPFAGIYRVIDFTLSNCINSKIDAVDVLVDHGKESVKAYLGIGAAWGFPFRGNLGLLEPTNGGYRGTADAVFQNLDSLKAHTSEEILVLAADHVYQMDYRPLIASHRRSGAEVTIAATRVPPNEVHRFGILTADSSGHVLRFEEKPERATGTLASMGLYVFNKDSLRRWLTIDAQDPFSCHDFGHSIIPRVVAEGGAAVYEFKGSWEDIGTIQSYYGANMEFLRQSARHSGTSWPVITQHKELPPPLLSASARVRDSIIGKGCQISGLVINSVLSDGVRIEAGAVVKDSIVMANTVIGRHSRVERAIVDEEVSIGDLCYIGIPLPKATALNTPTLVGYGAQVPSHLAVMQGAMVSAGADRLDFSRSVFGFAKSESAPTEHREALRA